MSTENYKSWQELLEDEPSSNSTPSLKQEIKQAPVIDESVALPEEYQALLEQKKELEQRMKKLTGQAEPNREEERQQVMYPVKIHTKKSRIEERKQKKWEEQQALLKQRSLEQKKLQAKAECNFGKQNNKSKRRKKKKGKLKMHW